MRIAVNDIEMSCLRRGTGPGVLLVHGFPLCKEMWQPQLEALAAAGFQAVAPDLRGLGDSQDGRAPTSMQSYADDLAALLDRLDWPQAVVVGMSMGGYVLLELLARHPQRVAAAVFAMTRSAADDALGKARRSELAEAVAAGRVQLVEEAFAGVLFGDAAAQQNPELVACVRGWMAAAPAAGLRRGLLAMRDRPDYTAGLAGLGLPSLVIGAEQDRAVPLSFSEQLVAGLPDARLAVIPAAGHMANLERPVAFNGELLAFLRGLPTWSA